MSRATPPVVVADAGPLIGLAKIGRLDLLRQLFKQVLIPNGVEEELRLESSRSGSHALSTARTDGWLTVEAAPDVPPHLLAVVDRGEAEAIILAKRRSLRLLIDEKRGRVAAQTQGVYTFGTGAMLILAKELQLIPLVRPELTGLEAAGYRISSRLRTEILRLAGE